MKWIKRGKLFSPQDHQLFGGCLDYAQSPQALELEDRVRIYFSTRNFEDTEKGRMFLSKTAYVDFTKDLSELLAVSNHEVLPLGELGTFDEHGIFPISPVRIEGKIYAYTCGWSRRKSVPVETSTGLVVSHDRGKTFQRLGLGPVFSSSVYEPVLVGDSFVRKFEDHYHMFYIYGQRWKEATKYEPPARVYKIAEAKSTDGLSWSRNKSETNLIPDHLNEDECQALPSVLKFGGRYHMIFCYRYATDFRTNIERGYRLGYAYSDDLVSWVRDEADYGLTKSSIGWDKEMMCYPHLFSVNEKVYLLYNGNEFGKYGFGFAELTEF